MLRYALVLSLAAAGCAHIDPLDKLELLHDSVEAYNHAFRWKAYDRAATYRLPEERTAFIAVYDDDQSSLQIEDYRVVRVNVIEDRSAEVTVRVRFLMLPSTVVQRSTIVQYWHKIGGNWLLESEKNPMRDMDLELQPRDKARLEGPKVSPEQEGQTELDVLGPGDDAPGSDL